MTKILTLDDVTFAALQAAITAAVSGNPVNNPTGPVVTPTGPVVTPTGPVNIVVPKIIDGLKVVKQHVSVDPQRTDLGDSYNVVFAIQVVAPEVLNPSYSGPSKGVLGNLLTIYEFEGQYHQRFGARTFDFTNIVWISGLTNMQKALPGEWFLWKDDMKTNKAPAPGVTHSAVSVY